MDRTFLALALLGTVTIGGATLPALAQAPKQQPAQQARPVKTQPSAASQLNAAAQGPSQAARVFDGGRVNTPTPVQVQPSTTTVNAAAIAARDNAAEAARQAAASRRLHLDNSQVPGPR